MTVKHLTNRRLKITTGDEYYTKLSTIERELAHYPGIFKGKVVYSNCDMPESNFVKYFSNLDLGLKDFIYSSNDFRSPESIRLQHESDIIVTNPPFSLHNEYLEQVLASGKKFIFICSALSAVYHSCIGLLLSGKLFLGKTEEKDFIKPNGEIAQITATRWLQNIKRHHNPPIPLFTANPKPPEGKWQRYLNYRQAYNLNKVKEITDFFTIYPDYMGKIGVPVTYIFRWNPQQFKILCRMDSTLVSPAKHPFARLMISRDQNAKIWDSAEEKEFSKNFFLPNKKNRISLRYSPKDSSETL